MKLVRKHQLLILCTTLSILVLACAAGCPKPGKKPPTNTPTSGGKGVGTNIQVFTQTIDSFNHLENHFGQESLTHILARLNGWITDQSPDPAWQEDAFFAEQEKSLSALAEHFAQLAKSLEKIIVADRQSGSALTPNDVQQAADLAKTLLDQLAATQEELGVRQLLEFRQSVGEVENVLRPFATVAKNMNMSEDAIREFFQTQFQQLGGDTVQLVHYFNGLSEIIGHFAEPFRGPALNFSRLDGDFLKQAFWCRNVAHWACGNRQEEIELAKELFDWTVRNIMLQTALRTPQGELLPVPPQTPWETLLFGTGSTADWAYVFVELLRQHRIDACLFVSDFQNAQGQTARLPWAVGVLLGGKVHVFLVRYGVPLVTEDEITLVPDKGLVFGQVATFDQLRETPELLLTCLGENFAVDQVNTLLAQTSLVIPADPIARSQRMFLLEKNLTGTHKTVLSASWTELKQRFENAMPGTTVTRWNYPFEAYFQSCLNRNLSNRAPDVRMELFRLAADPQQPYPLWKGRILYLSGRRTGQGTAAGELQHACISEQERNAMMDKSAAAFGESGMQLEMQIRELETALQGASPADTPELQAKWQELLQMRNNFEAALGMNLQGLQLQAVLFEIAGATANYWLGQIHFEEALLAANASNRKSSLNAAYDYVHKRIINNYKPHLQQWRHGANYHLGRVCEMQGKYEEAMRYYSTASPESDRIGRLFRAKQIERLTPKDAKE